MRIVDVQNRNAVFGKVFREQELLRFEIGFHRLVVIEMVLREVAEQRAPERNSGDAALMQRMAGSFHHEVGAAGGNRLRGKGKEVQKARGRERRRHRRIANLVLDSPEQRGLLAGGFEHRVHEEGAGRLPVGPGNRMALEFRERILVKELRGFQAGGLHVGHLNPLGGNPFGSRLLAHYRNRARGDRIAGEFLVAFRRHREEQVLRLHAAGVIAKSFHIQIAHQAFRYH